MIDPNDILSYSIVTTTMQCACGRAASSSQPMVWFTFKGGRKAEPMFLGEPYIYADKPISLDHKLLHIPVCDACISQTPRKHWTKRATPAARPQHSNILNRDTTHLANTNGAGRSPKPKESLSDLLKKVTI